MLVFREEISRYQLTLRLRQDIYYGKLPVDVDTLALMGIRLESISLPLSVPRTLRYRQCTQSFILLQIPVLVICVLLVNIDLRLQALDLFASPEPIR